MSRFVILASLFACIFAPWTKAGDLFSLTATGGTTTVRGAGSNVINLVQDLADNSASFAPLKNQPFTSTLNYAGVSNALNVSQSFDGAGHRIVNVQVPSTGLNRTFSSANGNLDDQLREFLKHEGLAALSDFQQTVNRTSAAGAVDGNPLAATALLADAGYQQFALHRSPFELNGERYTTASGRGESRFWMEGGVLDGGDITGAYASATLASEYHFNDAVALAFTVPIRWETLRGANIFSGGMVLGLPLTIIPGRGSNSLAWTITPAGHGAVVGSADFASGGLLYGGQVDNSISYTVGALILTIASEAGYFHGANISIAGYDFDTKLNQWVFKNGLQATRAWGNFFVDGSATWTNFLHDTYVDGYLTPQVGLGFRFGKGNASGLRIGYIGNFGNHYSTNGGSILLFFTG